MKFPRFTVAAALLVTVLCRAQTPPLASATMQQTIALINTAFARQDQVANPDGGFTIDHQRVTVDAPCVLSYYDSFQAGDRSPRADLVHVRLDQSDARSVRLVKLANPGTPVFRVLSSQAASSMDAANHFDASPDLGSFTTSQTASAVVDAYRHAIDLCHGGTAEVQSQPRTTAFPPPPPPAPASGPTMEQTFDFIKSALADQGDVEINFVDGTTAKGIQRQVRRVPDEPCKVDIFIASEKLVTIDLSTVDPRSVRILGWVAYNKETGMKFSEINPEVYVPTLLQKTVSTDRGVKEPELGEFHDKATAERVAKAWIHAAVLCHKEEAPSPF